MKIVAIFETIKDCFLSVQYDNKDIDEFSYLMDCWSDVEFLRTFFRNNETELNRDFYGGISINRAIEITLEEAVRLENNILEIAELGKTDNTNTLQTLFKPLNNNENKISPHQPTKAKPTKKSWLRIYAIRIAPNLFVVSGGGIKLTHRMEESEHLRIELQKLDITKKYLLEIGLLDEHDYELLEF